MRARVPASSANLGPGFDTLAVALSRYLEVSVEESDSFAISSRGCGAGLYDDERHLGAQVVARILGHWRFSIEVESEIPLSRGLGSSAALAAAAAAAAGSPNPLSVATEVDGHAENAAASVHGGLVAAKTGPDYVVVRPLVLDPSWRFVVVVPDRELATADARRVLPESVPFADAVANVTAVSLLIAGLARREDFVAMAMDDRLHQPYRSTLLGFASPLLERLRDAGASGSCWSGAGSTMLALCGPDTATGVADAARDFLVDTSVPGEVWELDAALEGLRLDPS